MGHERSLQGLLEPELPFHNPIRPVPGERNRRGAAQYPGEVASADGEYLVGLAGFHPLESDPRPDTEALLIEPVAQRGGPDETRERVLGVPGAGNLLGPRGGEQVAHGSQRSNPIQ